MTSTRSAAGTGLPNARSDDDGPHDNFPERQGRLFDRRHAEWLAACAEQAALYLREANGEDLGDEVNAASDRVDDARRALMTTYPPRPHMVWIKFKLFEQVLLSNPDDYTDKKHIWMLGCIKADFMAHCFEEARR